MSDIPAEHTAVGVLNCNRRLTSFPVSTPTPGPREVLIKAKYIGHTPLSQWRVDFSLLSGEKMILGGNVVGKIVAVGQEVRDLIVGDMVMSFTFGDLEHSPCQEYVLAKQNVVCKVPDGVTPQQAAAVPDSFVSAYHTLATELDISLPTELPSEPPEHPNLPILVWGGSSSVGCYVLQILKASGYCNVITTASERSFPSLRPLAAHLVSYASLPDAISTITSLLPAGEPVMVIDCIGDSANTVEPIGAIVRGRKGSQVGMMLPVRSGGYGRTDGVDMEVKVDFGEGVQVKGVRTHFWEKNEKLRDVLQTSVMPTWMSQGYIRPQNVREIDAETFFERCERALGEIRDGKVRGEKLVTRVW